LLLSQKFVVGDQLPDSDPVKPKIAALTDSFKLSRDERYDRADEFLDVVCKLWDSWRDGALVLDAETPQFADPSLVQPIDHRGKWFNVRGPLNVSRSPQGRPVFIQAGASDRGRDFAARWAEIIFVTHVSVDSAKEFYRDMKARAAKAGRDPDQMKILPGMVPIVAETKAMAEDKRKLIDDLADPQAGLSTLSYHLDIDLSQFPQDRVLPTLDVPGVQGHYKEVAEMTQRRGLTLSQTGKQYGVGPLREFFGCRRQAGTVVPRRRLRWLHAANALRSGRLGGFRAARYSRTAKARTAPARL
jgi:alkanesulfonate monooxygenase SsuD/methylene tetrahydromethanopterin reductase-like flavin-dependent oxidoreductase (luciferase family)